MAGSALDTFGDFMLATGPTFLTGPEDVINEATLHTYVLGRFMAGKEMSEMIQGGSTIKDTIFFDEDSTYEHYKPNAAFTYRPSQVLTEHEIDWRFSKAEMVWTDQEIGLNMGDLSATAKFHKFKTLKRTKEQNLWTSIMNGMENDLWSQPPTDGGLMEDTDGDRPYSLPAFINEFGYDSTVDTVLPTTDTAADHHPQGWTTVQGIDPATQAKWANPYRYYFNDTTATTFDLFPAMSNMWHTLRFDQLPMRPDLSEGVSSPQLIACSLLGLTNYEDMLRQSQDSFVTAGRQDPAYNHPTFRGIDLVYVSTLDTAAIYADGNDPANDGWTTETTDTTAFVVAHNGPRYWFLNGKYLNKVWHRDRYFHKLEPFSPSTQPFTKVCLVDVWHNLVCRSRRRHGMVGPGRVLAA